MKQTILLSPILAILVAACSAPVNSIPADSIPADSISADNAPLLPEGPLENCFVAGRSVENRPIPCVVFGSGPVTVFFIASIHGNEQAGTPLLEGLAEHLRRHPELTTGRRVVLLPEANPDGMAHNTRNNAHNVDLNRNFAAPNRKNSKKYGMNALSEPESAVIEKLIRLYTPTAIVTLHQPISCIDYDGPAVELARRISALCNLPVRKLGARPGSLGSWAGLVLGIPIITIELPEKASHFAPSELWRRYGEAILAAIGPYSPA